MESAINVENVWKRYRKGQTGYNTLREDIYSLTGRLTRFGRASKASDRADDAHHLWALRDVSFRIDPGERVGIIGRNGSGKTTMLRLLAGITRPTHGKISINGKIGALIEIMAGFHPELTGRENVYLNGAIMGMGRKEINRKFDEIVAFAELEDFIDTPIKRYSSGMNVRLGFSVAAHLDPEILLIDEVLSVGDAAFRQKSLEKMESVAQRGSTVVFVSHNVGSVGRLCPRAIQVDAGAMVADGPADEVIEGYSAILGFREASGVREYEDERSPGDEYVRLKSVRLLDGSGNVAAIFRMDQSVTIELRFDVNRSLPNFHLYLGVYSKDGVAAFVSGDWDEQDSDYSTNPGHYVARCIIPGSLLNYGSYSLAVSGVIPKIRFIFREENILAWQVIEQGGAGGIMASGRPGIFRPRLRWVIEHSEHADV